MLNITRALSDAPTREEVEAIVCERLATSDLYRFAWIGERAIDEDAIAPRTAAGVEDGYLEEVSVTAGGNVTDRGPGGRALQTGEVQVVRDVRSDESFEPWREAADPLESRRSPWTTLIPARAVSTGLHARPTQCLACFPGSR